MSDRIHVNHQQPPAAKVKGQKKVKQYEYKFFTYIAQGAEEKFNVLGESGWYFIGQAATGASVFVREKL